MAKQNSQTRNCATTQAIYRACLDVDDEWDRVKALPERSGARGWRAEELASCVLGSPIKKEKDFYADILLPNGRGGEVKSIDRVKGMMLFDKLPISERLSYRFKRRLEELLGGLDEFEAFFRRERYQLTRSNLSRVIDPDIVAAMIHGLLHDVKDDMREHNIDLIVVLRSHGFLAHIPHERFVDYVDLGMIWGNKLRLILRPEVETYTDGCMRPPKEWLTIPNG